MSEIRNPRQSRNILPRIRSGEDDRKILPSPGGRISPDRDTMKTVILANLREAKKAHFPNSVPILPESLSFKPLDRKDIEPPLKRRRFSRRNSQTAAMLSIKPSKRSLPFPSSAIERNSISTSSSLTGMSAEETANARELFDQIEKQLQDASNRIEETDTKTMKDRSDFD